MADVQTPGSTTSPSPKGKRSWLDVIEGIGNKVPHPAIIFLGLCVLVIVLSAILAAFDVKVTYEVAEPPSVQVTQNYETGSQVPDYTVPPTDYQHKDTVIKQETTAIKSLLSVDGVRFLFTSLVSNFSSFSVVAVILVAMLGVGVAEEAGLMGALIRKLVKVAPAWAISWIIVFIGVISSVASDAGYLILIPLAAAAYASLGRHPLAGLAAAYAGVAAAFGVNILITPSDGILTEVTNEAIALVDPNLKIGITANLWFNIVSTFFLTTVIVFVSSRLVEKRLGPYDPAEAETPTEGFADPGGAGTATAAEVDVTNESRGLRFAGYAVLACLVVVVLLAAPPGAPLRNPVTGSLVNDAPLMESLIVIITLIFLAAGIGYGHGARSLTGSTNIINAITKTWASLAGLLFMLFLIAQFIAYFNFSNMPTVISVAMADVLEAANIGPVWLLIGFVVVIAILDIIIPGLLPKWAIFAPVFIPLFIRLGVAPQTLLAAYRLGDSPMNVITPLMVYLPFIVLVAQRYKKTAGLGTIIALMIPYSAIVLVAWLVFFIAWFLLGIPMGPGYPANL
ncbi:MAG TPA: AbgT family transporter [Pseudonocardia sp.]